MVASLELFDVCTVPTLPVFTHLVTLVNRRTEQEITLTIETLSDRFCDVLREVSLEKAKRGLFGWELFEAICTSDCF